GHMDDFADKVRIQINDTHPALVIAELMRLLTSDYNMPWGKALEVTRTVCSYTNHTLLKEALEEWNINRVEDELPRQYKMIERLNREFCNQIRDRFPGDENRVKNMSILYGDQIRMAHLAIYGSHKVNGVARLHSELLKQDVFKDFYELWPEKFTNVTNGVTQRRWLMLANPKLTEFINQRIGFEWSRDFSQIAKLKPFASDPQSQKAFLEIKRENKEKLLAVLYQQIEQHPSNSHTACDLLLPPTALFDVQIKRFHEYKRQIMNVLHVIMLYQELKADPNCRAVPRLVILGGKAAPGYAIAKDTIQLIYCLARSINHDPETNHKLKICFFENYNVTGAEVIIPAADLSEQISMAGMEASGTGNMKLSMNGALTIGTEDGANIEMHEAVTSQWWPFSFGATAEQNLTTEHNPQAILAKEPKIQAALQALIDGSLIKHDNEAQSLRALYDNITQSDRFRVLQDIMPYYETQKKVEQLFAEPEKWAEYAIHNMAGMATFSTDESIKNYATDIWDIKPCPPNPLEIARLRAISSSDTA
ncbi:MAG TPA: glycogen/starch/alpha-glucan family phosphorylase, partial [Chlamydiales bacterium]|nr:glycogen/starch/alpha-glucan family phosphorylase [Chlamydiales bacterium]